MSNVGIISEYNPLHNGHIYHINESKKMTGADTAVCVMSGNFVQRGMPSILPKHSRAKYAISNGADLVIELPTVFAVASSDIFAKAGVKLLEAINCDYLSFGSEEGDINKLNRVLNNLKDKRLDEHIKSFCGKGYSYPKARELAYHMFYGEEDIEILSKPNNILGLDYLKYSDKLKPVTVMRMGSAYNEPGIKKISEFQSATAIRKAVYGGIDVEGFVPYEESEELKNSPLVNEDKLFQMLRYKIITGSAEDFERCPSAGEGLGNKLKNEINKADSLEELAQLIKSKRYTRTRINRLLIQVLLGIDKNIIDYGNVGYIKFLAANEKGTKLLNDSNIDVISNVNKADLTSDAAKYYLEKEILAGDIYNSITGRNLYKNSEKVLKPIFING